MKEPSLLKVVERTLVQAVWRWQRAEARRLGVSGRAESGAVAMAQYFGGRMQLTPHLHVLVPEVVWDEAGRPVQLPPPDEGAVEAVLVRAVRQLARRWLSEEVRWVETISGKRGVSIAAGAIVSGQRREGPAPEGGGRAIMRARGLAQAA